ncbi:succinate dehydrogenase assembly factor 2, mitochondrial isoform X3 [Pteropus medius]|uniref:succinate dehydrogenase assembly factor 2, mitochondrial isoform X3 n=1 Tax=Pteropus vampyrus TaxID=132908 RepID=UPI00196B68D1|nr:succinate dehydrogenase assembly factor 2, mitochondrial isoform X3 [Pteropus giganteus]
MLANLTSPETQPPGGPSLAPPAPPRPRPRAAPRSPRPPGLAGLAAHHPRARPELRCSRLWRDGSAQASAFMGPRTALRRTPAAKPAAPAQRTCLGPRAAPAKVQEGPGAPATPAPHPGQGRRPGVLGSGWLAGFRYGSGKMAVATVFPALSRKQNQPQKYLKMKSWNC